MNNSLEKIELIDDFKDYQIDWLLSHFDIEFEEKVEDTVIQFIKDTAQCYINEMLYKDSEKLEKVNKALKNINEVSQSDSIEDKCYRYAVKYLQDIINGKTSIYDDIHFTESLYPKENK